MPTYGEGGAEDESVANQFRAMFLNIPTTIVNDAKVGWAGALAMNPGVNIVAGTGSIAFGCDGNGNCARSGGWSELFSDEGSGYWLGRMALGLFAKESDGRAPKSALYYLMKTHLDIRHDEEICSIARQKVFTSRHNVAKLQLILANAALQGDESAAWLYNLAGRELASCVHAVVKKLNFKGVANVSYSGGIFNVGDLILAPFKNALGRGVVLHEPILCPEVGAALIAVEQFQPNSLQNLKDILVRNCK